MPRKSKSSYPSNWPQIAKEVKESVGFRCVRCGHRHDPETGYTLTVHHMDMDPSNNRWWNLIPLCQRCHLQVQNKVTLEQFYMFPHSEWFKPYVAGYYAFVRGLGYDRDFVLANVNRIVFENENI